jgi:hypothetical protein
MARASRTVQKNGTVAFPPWSGGKSAISRTLMNCTVWDHIHIRHTGVGFFGGMTKQGANPVGHGPRTGC